jgi:hypothetical protein
MSDDRSPDLDELDALMEKVQAKAPAVGDNAKATLVLALALIDVQLAALEWRSRSARRPRLGSIDL